MTLSDRRGRGCSASPQLYRQTQRESNVITAQESDGEQRREKSDEERDDRTEEVGSVIKVDSKICSDNSNLIHLYMCNIGRIFLKTHLESHLYLDSLFKKVHDQTI